MTDKTNTGPEAEGRERREGITPSSGNVFADLGFDPGEAENLRIRSHLMIALKRFISEGGMTQAEAADLFGVTQPRVSDLVRGKIDKFSIDTLVNMLAKAGRNVSVRVDPPEGEGEPVLA